ncbi:MAG: hypothetical protein WA653_07590 [Candidatus Sulfotelmatobacter sp.]
MLTSHVVVLHDNEAISVFLVFPELNISPLNGHELAATQASTKRQQE